MSGVIEIVTLIFSAVELATKIAEVAHDSTPAAPADLKDKHRWLQCTIKNETQFSLLLNGNHFDSGRYEKAPGTVAPFSQAAFSCCNRDGSILTGVSGGTSFDVVLDDQHKFSFALGWTNPQSGSFKAGVAESSKAEDGYNVASVEGNSITSQNVYRGKDKENSGAQVDIRFHVSAASGQEPLFSITEVRV